MYAKGVRWSCRYIQEEERETSCVEASQSQEQGRRFLVLHASLVSPLLCQPPRAIASPSYAPRALPGRNKAQARAEIEIWV